MPDPQAGLRVSRTVFIPEAELEWRFSGAGGPGGQHANTANTRVEVRFSIIDSNALGPRQKERLRSRLGAVVRVVATDERSQLRNRALARQRLAERLRDALKLERQRRPTQPTPSSVERRLREKRRASQQKQLRRPPGED